jgi:hypothetical protein
MVSQIHRELEVKVPLIEMFKFPTITELSQYILDESPDRFISIPAIERCEYYPLSSAQQRMYIQQSMKPGDAGYNNPAALVLEGKLDGAKLEQVFKKLIRRHESLRTSFHMINEEPVQRIFEPGKIEFAIEYYRVGAGRTVSEIIESFIRPFDLSRAPLMRVELISLNKSGDEHILLLDMHHIITDGVSLGIFSKEFMALYSGEALPSLKLQYKDFTKWQNRFFRSGEIVKQENYWLKQFAGDIPLLNLDGDFPRPGILGGEGSDFSFEIDGELTAELRKLTSETDATIYILLLSICNILFSKYSRQEDIIIGGSIAGRHHADLDNIVGMFVNMLAIRNRPVKNKKYAEFLKEVKDNALNAYGNQDFQFDDLVRRLNLQGIPGRNPIFDVIFKLQNMDIPRVTVPGLVLKPYSEYRDTRARFDMVIAGTEVENSILININYSTHLFKRSTIEKMSQHFIEILKQVIKEPQTELQDIRLSSKLSAVDSTLREEETQFGF